MRTLSNASGRGAGTPGGDSSPGRHATRHFESSGHAVIRSIEAGESWTWCYVHQQMFA